MHAPERPERRLLPGAADPFEGVSSGLLPLLTTLALVVGVAHAWAGSGGWAAACFAAAAVAWLWAVRAIVAEAGSDLKR